MFDPQTKECITKKKFAVSGKCNSFKECILKSSVSPAERWAVAKCGSSLHFDPIRQECVNSVVSTCGDYSVGF